MNSNITEPKHFATNLQLGEPHFEEEATMLSARPVVPLAEIGEAPSETGSKRRLTFGVAILAALVLGAVGATLVFKQRLQKPVTEIVNTAIPGSGATANDSATLPALTGAVQYGGAALPADVAPPPAARQKAASPVVGSVKQQKSRPARTSATDKEEVVTISPEEEWEMRRAQRMEERRTRRRAERDEPDPRDRRRRRSDDLLKIREIFEGSRRP